MISLTKTFQLWAETMTDNRQIDNPQLATDVDETGDTASQTLAEARRIIPLQQQLEALLLVADEPVGAVHLATAVDRPVREVRGALAALVADYDGVGEGPERGFELREVAGGYRFYVRESLDPVVADFVQQHHEIPWAALYAMRNRLSHGYWAVDLAVVWQVIERDLGALKRELERISGQT